MGVEVIYKFCAMGQISSWFPGVMSSVIAFPLDQILKLVVVLAAVKNGFNFVF